MSGITFGCHSLGEGCTWQIVGREQGCCSISYDVSGSPYKKELSDQNVNSAKIQKPRSREGREGEKKGREDLEPAFFCGNNFSRRDTFSPVCNRFISHIYLTCQDTIGFLCL